MAHKKSTEKEAQMKKTICNRCGVTYDDEDSVKMVEQWQESGYAPCPNLDCPGQLEIKEQEEPKCPRCLDPLLIKAVFAYDIYFENGSWHKADGSVEYFCGNCRAVFNTHEIEEALEAVDEL